MDIISPQCTTFKFYIAKNMLYAILYVWLLCKKYILVSIFVYCISGNCFMSVRSCRLNDTLLKIHWIPNIRLLLKASCCISKYISNPVTLYLHIVGYNRVILQKHRAWPPQRKRKKSNSGRNKLIYLEEILSRTSGRLVLSRWWTDDGEEEKEKE